MLSGRSAVVCHDFTQYQYTMRISSCEFQIQKINGGAKLRRLFAIGGFIAVVLSNGQWAVCAPSGLNVIPTADVLDKGDVSLEIESDGRGRPWGDDCDSFSLLQFGVGNGVELGVDQCLNNPDTWINIKWRVCDESGRLPALALGVQGISYDELAQPYIAVLKSIGDTRFHMGAMKIDHKTRLVFGLDRPLGSRVTFQADYTSGDENSTTYGIAVSLSNSLSLTLVRSLGNAVETGNGHIINLAWSPIRK